MFRRQRRKTKLRDFPKRYRVAIFLLSLVQLGLLATALWDLRHRPQEAVRGSKRLWTLAVFVNFVGPLLFFWKGRRPLSAERRTVAA